MELHSTPQAARSPEQGRRITNKPMMLKDYIWQETSSANGFLAYPRWLPNTATVRSLLELDHRSHGRPKLMRSGSKAASAAINKLQAASTLLLNAVKFIHCKPLLGNGSDRHKPSFLPRSLSRRLSKSKRSRKQVEDNLHTSMTLKVKDIIRWKSFTEAKLICPQTKCCPHYSTVTLPVQKSYHNSSTTWSSCTWSDSDLSLELGSTSSSDLLVEQVGGYGGKRPPARRERRREKKGVGEEEEESVAAPAAYYRKPKVKGGEKGGSECSYEEKQQLSPVSVLDFPDEDGNSPSSSSSASSAHFHRLANVERAKKFVQKIGGFESMVELKPVNLESRISEFEHYSPTSGGYNLSDDEEGDVGEEDHAKELLMNYIVVDKEMELSKADRELVLDFLSEGLRNGNTSVEELVVVAEKWAIGRSGVAEGRWGVEDMREWHVKEMEGDGRWRTFGEEGEEMAAAVAMAVVEELIIELFC